MMTITMKIEVKMAHISFYQTPSDSYGCTDKMASGQKATGQKATGICNFTYLPKSI